MFFMCGYLYLIQIIKELHLQLSVAFMALREHIKRQPRKCIDVSIFRCILRKTPQQWRITILSSSSEGDADTSAKVSIDACRRNMHRDSVRLRLQRAFKTKNLCLCNALNIYQQNTTKTNRLNFNSHCSFKSVSNLPTIFLSCSFTQKA